MKATNSQVIIIRGAPGSGKTEISKSLAKFFPTGARIEVDSLRKMVISVNWTNQSEHVNLLGISARLAGDFLSRGISPVIIVDTFSGNKLQKFIDDILVHCPEVIINIFGLYLSKEVLIERLNNRDTRLFKDFQISQKINEETMAKKYQSETQFDTSLSNADDVAHKVYQLTQQN